MKKYLYIAVVMSMISLSCEKANAQIVWEKDVASAIKKAKSKDLPIMIDVYTDWCTWCEELDKNTYANKNVVNVAKKMISVKVNPETSDEGAALANTYAVEGYPTILFINAEGIVLERVGGYVEGDDFLPYMNKAISEHSRIKKIFANKEPSIEKLEIYIESNKEEEARVIYDLLKAQNKIPSEKMPVYLLGFGLMKAQKQDYKGAKEYFTNIISSYPNSDEIFITHYYYAVTILLEGDTNSAIKYVEALLKRNDIPKEMLDEYQRVLDYATTQK